MLRRTDLALATPAQSFARRARPMTFVFPIVALVHVLTSCTHREPHAQPSSELSPKFDASQLRTGRFVYHTMYRGADAGIATISITRTEASTYRFHNEVTGAFRQTWDTTSTASFQPLAVTLGLGHDDDKARSMSLVYTDHSVAGNATKRDPLLGPQTTAVSARIPDDTVDQRIDWAVMVSATPTPNRRFSFSVYDPWMGVSRVSARIDSTAQVRVPAGVFEAHRVVYYIEKATGTEKYEVWVSEESPRFLVREDFPNGAVTELTRVLD